MSVYFFVTVDTEDNYFDVPRMITGEGLEGRPGVYLIMDILEKHGLRGVFFFNTTSVGAYPSESVLANIARDIHRRGHEVGLHVHGNETHPDIKYDITRYSKALQLKFISQEKKRLEEWIGAEVISYRSGSYAVNTNTLDAVSAAGFRFDSSRFFNHPANKALPPGLPANIPFTYKDIIEFPVTYLRLFDNDKELDGKLDVNWLDLPQALAITRLAVRENVPALDFMMHSFSFMKYVFKPTPDSADDFLFESKWAGISGVREPLIKDFDTYLAEVVRMKGIQPVTFKQLDPERLRREIASSDRQDYVFALSRNPADGDARLMDPADLKYEPDNAITLNIADKGQPRSLPLYFSGNAAITELNGGEGNSTLKFHYQCPPEPGFTYLATREDAYFDSVPQLHYLTVPPNQCFELRATIGGLKNRASLWLIQYSEDDRLGHDRVLLTPETRSVAVPFMTHSEAQRLVLAVRLSGEGDFEIGDVVIAKTRPTKCDPRGYLERYTIFHEPGGYLHSFMTSHNRNTESTDPGYYKGREPSWYAGALQYIEKFAPTFRSILEIGSGPGLFGELIRAKHPKAVYSGLEYSPSFLNICLEKKLNVHVHDLNYPFPYLKTESKQVIFSHQCMDYLTPIAFRCILREAFRCLEPGGTFVLISRAEGRAAGDPTRTIPYTLRNTEPLFEEAGFEILDRVDGRNISLAARKPVQAPPRAEGPIQSHSGDVTPRAGGRGTADRKVVRTIPLGEETQVSGACAKGCGSLRFSFLGADGPCLFELRADGAVYWNGDVPVLNPAPRLQTSAFCIRVLRPDSAHPVMHCLVWRDSELFFDETFDLRGPSPTLELTAEILCDGQAFEHMDAWMPEVRAIEQRVDACLPLPASLPEAEALLREKGIERAIVVPSTETIPAEWLGALRAPGREFYPVGRVLLNEDTLAQQIAQYAELWTAGRFLAAQIKPAECASGFPAPLAEWLETRLIPVLWQAGVKADLDWVERHALSRPALGSILNYRGPLTPAVTEHLERMLQTYPHLYLLTSSIDTLECLTKWGHDYPHQLLYSAAVRDWRDQILQWPSGSPRNLVLAENTRFLTERARWGWIKLR